MKIMKKVILVLSFLFITILLVNTTYTISYAHISTKKISGQEQIITNNMLSNENNNIINVKFNDLNLYNALIQELGDRILFEQNESEKTIIVSLDEIKNVKSLKLNNNEIKSVKGLEQFIYLEDLNLRNNLINDISGLKTLTNLKKLDVSHNILNNLNEINQLVNLKELNVYDNIIYDFNGLAGMQNLEVLIAGDNNEQSKCTEENMKISSIGTLTNLKQLDFSRNHAGKIINQVTKLSSLEKLDLQECNIDDNYINSCIGDFDKLVSVKELNLFGNSILTIDPFIELTQLEDFDIGNNKIKLINKILKDNELVWGNLKKINISGNSNIAQSTNYTENKVAIDYLIEKNSQNLIFLNYEFLNDTTALPHTDENGIQYVTYDDFGARCDGIHDDFVAIRNAHNFANINNYEVRANGGKTYHIFKYNAEKAVNIKTNVNWENAKFIIHDEKIEDRPGRYSYIFFITTNSSDVTTIENPNIILNTNTKKIEGIEDTLNKLNVKNYCNYLCIAENSNKKQYIRYGSTENAGINQNDCFIIDSEGTLQNDIQWDFDSITKLTIFPFSKNQLSIKNGDFITNTFEDSHESIYSRGNGKNSYLYRGMYFYATHNMTVQNIKHTTSKDLLSGVYHSFFRYQKSANVTMKDCLIYSHKYKVGSTYDLVVEQCVNFNCNNITSNDIKNTDRWGVTGTNNCKDVTFEECELNRIDSHQGIYNLNIYDCKIGCYGIAQIGQGTLNIINTAVEAETLIRLRGDYGSTWNGDINIINCTHKYMGDGRFKLLNYSVSKDGDKLHDFGYDLYMPNLYVENLTLDCESKKDIDTYLIVPNIQDSDTEIMPNSYWPKKIYINGYKFINNNSNNPKIQILNKNIDLPNINNYVITNTLFIEEDGNDLTNLFNKGEKITSNKNIKLEINQNSSCKNIITIYKDNINILEQEVRDKFEYLFNEAGKYKIKITSIDNVYNKTGTKIYEFEKYTLGHTFIIDSIKNANLNENGYIKKKCNKCGEEIIETIYYPISFELSKIDFTYNKKIQKPTIKVKDSKGNILRDGEDYNISYSNKKSKKIGEYTIEIKFKGNYEGTKKLKYKIIPKGTSLKKLTKGRKSIRTTWNKQRTETTGYQIEYSTDKKFRSKNKKKIINKNKITSYTIKKLKAKKKYYIRIRTYKKVKINGKNVKIYSKWSKYKSVKTK